MVKPNDLSRSRGALEEDSTLIAVIEMSLGSWLVAGRIPGVDRNPLRKQDPDPDTLLIRLHQWRDEAVRAGHPITRIAVAFEAGRDGFWLARWLLARGIEAYVIHPTSIPVKRDHRRAKTDRLDTALLIRAFVGWLRGEADHCSMAAVPTLEEEDRKRPNREPQTLSGEKTRIINRVKGALVSPRDSYLQSEAAECRWIVSINCAAPKECRSHRTRSRSSDGTLPGCALSPNRPGPLRRHGWTNCARLRLAAGMLWSGDANDHLVEVPPVARAWAGPSKPPGKPGPELQNPPPHRFVGNLQDRAPGGGVGAAILSSVGCSIRLPQSAE